MTSVYERVLTTTGQQYRAHRIDHAERPRVVKIFLQPGASVDAANAQVTGMLRRPACASMPPGRRRRSC